jgi:crotonobetainyl-CoA:carnitine CoA-transferase CaiB-like acyl-CoA transferase
LLTGPLAGIRVVDLSQIVSGPMAACILAEQGADVVKVESVGGDPIRGLGPRKGDLSAMFIAVNHGKRGLALDLKKPEATTVLDRLIARSDVLIENFRPGVIDRLGFGYDRCRRLNARLVYTSINGFGPDGPYANIRVYDPVVQAVSGLAALQAGADGAPHLIQTLIADKTTALTAAQAITAALYFRERSGTGQRIDIAMLDAAIAFAWPDGMWNETFLDDAPPPWPPYGAQMRLWEAADGQVAIGALQDSEFAALCDAVGRPDLAADPRLATVVGRNVHRADWTPALSSAVKAMSVDALMAAFVRTGAVGGRVNRVPDVAADPQVIHNSTIANVDHGAIGRVALPRAAARFADGGSRPGVAPGLGEHSREILRELGHTDVEIDALVASGSVVASSVTAQAC